MNIYNNNSINSIIDNIIENDGFEKNFKYHYLYIIFHIRTYPFKDRTYAKGCYVPIKLEYLRKLISYDYASTFLKNMVSSGLLETDNYFLAGSKSHGFRISEKFDNDKYYLEEIKDTILAKKLRRTLDLQKGFILNRYDGYSYVTAWMEKLEIDQEKSIEYIRTEIKNQKIKDSYQIFLDIFNEKFAKVDDIANRLHNNLTNLATPLRSYLTLDGKKLVQADLKNSQPLFLYVLIKEYHIPQEELNKYKDIVCNYGFYEFFADKLKVELNETNRVDFKRSIFGGVLFDKNRQVLSKYEKVFKEEFPTIFYVMRGMKSNNYKQIAISLQKIESRFIFHCIDRLRFENKNIELLTIHDSIVTVEGKESIVHNIMSEEFYKLYSIEPKIKLDKFG